MISETDLVCKMLEIITRPGVVLTSRELEAVSLWTLFVLAERERFLYGDASADASADAP